MARLAGSLREPGDAYRHPRRNHFLVIPGAPRGATVGDPAMKKKRLPHLITKQQTAPMAPSPEFGTRHPQEPETLEVLMTRDLAALTEAKTAIARAKSR